MISVQQSDIPDYLLNSAFYLSLDNDEGNPEAIQIPERCFKKNDDVSNLEDFGQLLHTIQFWDVITIPEGLIKYVDSTDCNVWHSTAEDILDPMSPVLADLKSVFRNSYPKEYRFQLALEAGRCELLEFWLKTGKYSAKQSSSLPKETDIAVKKGRLDCLQMLHQYHFTCDRLTANEAARSGSLECLRYLHDHNCPWDSSVLKVAAKHGHLHILKYAHQQGLVWDSRVCLLAAEFGHLSCLRYAHEHGCPWSSDVTFFAAGNGHFDSLKYALEQGCEMTYDAAVNAAAQGRLHCLKLLRDYDDFWNALLPSTAAYHGHLHILQYLHEHHCPWDAGVYASATAGDHLDCMQYAHSQGLLIPAALDTSLCMSAAECGHLKILKYLHENGFEWSETVFAGIQQNHLEIVQYAISHGCDWDKHECNSLAISRYFSNIDMVRYLFSLWTPSKAELHTYAIKAAQYGVDSILRYLVEEQHQDITNDTSVFSAALAAGRVACVRYCFEKGCRQVDYDTLCAKYCYNSPDSQMDRRILECLQYLMEQGWEIPDPFLQFVLRFQVKLPYCKAFCSTRKATTAAGPSKRAKLM